MFKSFFIVRISKNIQAKMYEADMNDGLQAGLLACNAHTHTKGSPKIKYLNFSHYACFVKVYLALKQKQQAEAQLNCQPIIPTCEASRRCRRRRRCR